MAFVEDFAAYMADFGVPATLDGRAVRVIFGNAYEHMLDVGAREPRAGLPTTDAGAATRGSTLVLAAVTYKVRAVRPDGTGWTALALEA
jgi:hypothetical protein